MTVETARKIDAGHARRRRRKFSRGELLALDRARDLARGLVAEDSGLDFDDILNRPVDIKTQAHPDPAERARGVFAQLFRYVRPEPVAHGGRPDHFRIRLYDSAILKALDDRPGLTLEALLTYILTHEFLHVARFARFMELFSQDETGRAAEEEVVHAQTFRLLRKIKMPGLPQVLELYAGHRLPMD